MQLKLRLAELSGELLSLFYTKKVVKGSIIILNEEGKNSSDEKDTLW